MSDEDIDYSIELTLIRATQEEHQLVQAVQGLTQRRQMSQSKHAALLGEAYIHAAKREWLPEGKEALKAYCKQKFGYSLTQMGHYKRIAVNYARIHQSADFLLQARSNIAFAETKLPEPGSVAFANKAQKAHTAYEEAIKAQHGEDIAMQRAADALAPPAKLESNSLKERYQAAMVLLMTMLQYDETMIDSVIEQLVPGLACDSMSTLDESLKGAAIKHLCEFYEDDGETHRDELIPPWKTDEPDAKEDLDAEDQEDDEDEPNIGAKTQGRSDTDDRNGKRTEAGSDERAHVMAEVLQLVQDGQSVRKAIASLKLARSKIYRWRKEDAEFDAALSAAVAKDVVNQSSDNVVI